ncbi:9467_t:CDS:1, partial [Cetraspora pellucida]
CFQKDVNRRGSPYLEKFTKFPRFSEISKPVLIGRSIFTNQNFPILQFPT